MNARLSIPLFLALVPASGVGAQDSGAWPQLHGPGGDRRTAEPLRTSWPADGPRVPWRVETPLGFSSFSAADGRLYTLVTREVEGVRREVCVALDAETGEQLWESDPLCEASYDGGGDAGAAENKGGDGARTTPSAAGSAVFVLDSALVLTALEAATGATLWRHDLVAEYGGRNIRWQNAASPLVEGDLVLVAGGGEGQSLLAFEREDGALAWAAHDERMTHATPIAATIDGVRQAIFLVQSGLLSVDPRTGTELWRAEYPYRTSTGASPVVWADLVYVSAGYGVGAGVYRVTREGDAWTPTLLWQRRNELVNHWSTPVCVDGYLYGMFSFKKYGEGPLACVWLETGATMWEEPGFGPGNVVAAGEQLVALSDAGELVLVEPTPDAYRELARADVLEGKCWSSPAVAGGQVFVRSTVEGARVDLSSAADE